MLDRAPLMRKVSTFDEAWLFCATLDYKGFSDWRLPTWGDGVNISLPRIYWHSDRNQITNVGYCVLAVRDIC